MKVSMRWLGRLVDLDGLSAEEIREDLTMHTCEVEDLVEYGAGLDDLVVGHVLECGRHPHADKLSLARVDIGAGEPLAIVCGAPNVAAGQKVAVVPSGGRLPGGTRIKKTRIRGVESFGMICSEQELGLSDEHEGILVLHPGLRPGLPLTQALDVHDRVLEIDNKSINHRPDLWGHYGIAREIAAIRGRELRTPAGDVGLPARGRTVEIVIENLRDCPRFCGLVIENVEEVRSPDWMRFLLAAVGQRPLGLLVDLTNFVMLELGQPMHVFDLARLNASGIRVRRAREGEVLRTLDGVERRLSAEDIVVASGDRAVSIAGVMGGEDTAVGPATREVLAEAACWDPARTRRTSARLGLRTDASARFEKSLDPAGAELAIRRFVELLGEVQPGAKAAGPLIDPAGWTYRPVTVHLRRSRLAAKLGVEVGDDEVRRILGALRFGVRAAADGFDVDVPSFRATKDVRIEDDLIEEVGRMYGYGRIPEAPLPSRAEPPPRAEELWLARRLVEVAVLEGGCHEVMTYSFASDSLLAAVGAAGADYARVQNPVAPELARIRRHVLPSVLEHVAPNLRHAAEVRLVEHGKGYLPERRDADGLPGEVREVAVVWARREGPHPYGELRSQVASWASRVGTRVELEEKLGRSEEHPWTHPGRTAAITRNDRLVGYVGHLHPAAAHALELPGQVAIASLDVGALLAGGRERKRLAALPRYPSQPVDVALLVDEDVRVVAVERFLRECGGKLVRGVELFEVYRGEGLPPGKKSLNFTVVLGAEDRTLSSADEERFLSRVRRDARKIGAELRG